MKFRKEYIGLLAIIALLSLYIVFRNSDRTHYELPESDAVKRENVTKIVISREGEQIDGESIGSKSILLERSDEKWNIGPAGYPADKAAVDKMLDALEKFSLMTLVAESKNYSLYELEDRMRIKLEVFAGPDLILALDVGKAVSTRRHTFVRLEGDDDIYQANGNLRQVFDTGIDRLRDKTAVSINRDEVSGLTLMTTEGVIELTKTPEDALSALSSEGDAAVASTVPPWTTVDGLPADEKVIDQIVNALANLKCESYIEGRSKDELGDPLYTIVVKMPVSVILSIYAIENDKYPAFSSQNGYPFYLQKSRAEQIMKGKSEIIPDETSEK
ncbi:MAG: DUF4340 domain-containing protein [Bacteroidales bacterium]|nr:DUF4340 domain-containing protein [Candidatus Latescibacterota bacterium]